MRSHARGLCAFDIGLQALSGAAERNENIIYFCYDNEAYMNTGIQRSSATIELARLAVRSRVFPLVEVVNGTEWRFTLEPEPATIETYVQAQGRFPHLTEQQIAAIRQCVEQRYDELKDRCLT